MLKKITLLLMATLFAVLPVLAQTEEETAKAEEIVEVVKETPSLVEIVFILDRSGSMSGLEKDTIGGFNEFVKLQAAEGPTRLTTILFDDRYEVLHNGVDATDVQLTSKEYFVRGLTAMNDAIGKSIKDVEQRLRNTPKEEQPGKVIFVITTDGYENASKEYTQAKISELISKKQEEDKWEFLFFGANIDVKKVSKQLSIKSEYSFRYDATCSGTADMLMLVNTNVMNIRNGVIMDAPEGELIDLDDSDNTVLPTNLVNYNFNNTTNHGTLNTTNLINNSNVNVINMQNVVTNIEAEEDQEEEEKVGTICYF